jgi:hypothetical protein
MVGFSFFGGGGPFPCDKNKGVSTSIAAAKIIYTSSIDGNILEELMVARITLEMLSKESVGSNK